MLLHINPTRQRGKRTGFLARASGWYMTFFAAGVIIDGYAGEIENFAPVNLAVLVEIDDTVEESRSTTALARRFPRANGLQSRVHQSSPTNTVYII